MQLRSKSSATTIRNCRLAGRTQYNKPQLDDSSDVGKKLIVANGGAMLSGGTISLQSESHPCEFRKVELLVLKK